METFVFNSFKKNLVEGEYNREETWKLYPVNKKFTEDFADTIKYVKNHSDFELFAPLGQDELYSNYFDKYTTKMFKNTYLYSTMGETDVAQEPEYVTEESFDAFLEKNPDQEHLRRLFFIEDGMFNKEYYKKDVVQPDGSVKPEPVWRGFYYVRTSEELLWCANKVNGEKYDNEINIVLGDNIGINLDDYVKKNNIGPYNIDQIQENGNSLRNQLKKIRYCIGSNPAQPFNGVFFGNGFAIEYVELVSNSDVCGIIGYLGYKGWISCIHIKGYNVISNKKKINIDHLVYNGTDVCVGLLCGKNNGQIDRVFIEGKILINGFVPGIYSVNNKSDNWDNYDPDVYPYYPAYYCFDSPGNIIPYIGYFNEGVFATYSGFNNLDNKWYHYWGTMGNQEHNSYNKLNSSADYTPLEWQYTCGFYYNDWYLFYVTHEKNRLNVLWYDGKIIDCTERGLTEGSNDEYHGARAMKMGLFRIPSTSSGFDIELGDGNTVWKDMRHVSYFNKSIKLSQQNRAAYYVSPLVGVNNNNILATHISADIYTSGTFVGFLGGVAGKQNKGALDDINTIISAHDFINMYDENFNVLSYNDLTARGEYFYKRDMYKAVQDITGTNRSGTIKYYFPQKSIKNISSLFGSCTIGATFDQLRMTAVNSQLVNYNNIVFKNNATEPEYDDYYLMNRFGSFAAMVEYNSSNVSNCWNTLEQLNDSVHRPIVVRDCAFKYEQRTDMSMDGVKLAQLTETDYDTYGVMSPLFAEVKPTFQSTPSIISTFFSNEGFRLSEANSDPTYYRVGLFGIDQNIAAPRTDPYFWCVDYEVDLPGVGNRVHDGVTGNKFGMAGGIIDRLNNFSGYNFSMDIRYIPSKLIRQEQDSKIAVKFNGTQGTGIDYFNATRLPAAAVICSAVSDNFNNKIFSDGTKYFPCTYCGPSADLDMSTCIIPSNKVSAFNDVSKVPDGALVVSDGGALFSYNANKRSNIYAYFGSDLELDPPTASSPTNTDLPSFPSNKWVKYRLINQMYYKMPANAQDHNFNDHAWEGDHYVANTVKYVDIEINTSLLKYAPFTDVELPVTTKDEITANYIRASAILCTDLGANAFNHTYGTDTGYLKEFNYGSLTDWFSDGIQNAYLKPFFGLPTDAPNLSGFYIYSDRDNQSDGGMMTFMMPFMFEPYSDTNSFPNPPYQLFQGIYVRGYGGDHEDQHFYDIWRTGFINTPFEEDFTYLLAEDYNFKDDANTQPNVQPKRWYDLNYMGTFRNSLIKGKNDNSVTFSIIEDEEKTFSATVDILVKGFDAAAEMNIKTNIEHSVTAAGEEATFFKYTYLKGPFSTLTTPLSLNVSYNTENTDYYTKTDSEYKAGFWYKLPECSAGMNEYNDDIHYYGNIFTIGKTLNQDSILNGCLTGKTKEHRVSAFSADDFEGILVEDSDNRPVMYIDVGLGECNDGTTWSLSSYPSIDSAAYISAWCINYDKEHSKDPGYGDITEEDKLVSAESACRGIMNSYCSGLFLEVDLNGK